MQSLNEAAADKIRKYRADYNNNPPNAISFMPTIASTSGRLHSELVRLLFLQAHRETDRFFALSGVHRVQRNITVSVPLPPHCVLLATQVQDWEHSR